ncbi:MAG: hypothetical protein CTY19_08995 [Methylomonas sp.]|nr:MAG: hypothetical protein CTY19_08995 [Methylomonas sp.]
MSKIFISYRRDDSTGYAGRLADHLNRAFGDNQIFRDYDDIAPGQNFLKTIQQHLATADVLLVMIGMDWLSLKNTADQQRLFAADDLVRMEIETALRRGIRIIPILLNDAPMPSVQQLPESIARLAFQQAVELTDSRWEHDVALLTQCLRDLVAADQSPPRQDIRWPLRLALVSGLIGLVSVMGWLYQSQTDFSGHWYFEDGTYLTFTPEGQQFHVEHIDPGMQKTYDSGQGHMNGLWMEFTLEPIYTSRFKYHGRVKKAWNGQSLQGELTELLSDEHSNLQLTRQSPKPTGP